MFIIYLHSIPIGCLSFFLKEKKETRKTDLLSETEQFLQCFPMFSLGEKHNTLK